MRNIRKNRGGERDLRKDGLRSVHLNSISSQVRSRIVRSNASVSDDIWGAVSIRYKSTKFDLRVRCRLEGRFHSVNVTCLRECGGRCNLPSSELQDDRMHPFASYVLRSYYKATGWNEDNLYANLTRSSNGKYFAHSSEMIFTQAH